MGRLVSAAIVPQANVGPLSLRFSPASVHDLNAAVPAADKPASKEGDDSYAERIAKYVPAEVVAFFSVADKLFSDTKSCVAGNPTDCWISSHPGMVAWLVFLIGLVATPLYIRQQRTANQPWVTHAFMATIGFVVWSYTIHARVFENIGYSDGLSGFLTLVYSLASGFVVPTAPAAQGGGVAPKPAGG
jgi:hypothetical protein